MIYIRVFSKCLTVSQVRHLSKLTFVPKHESVNGDDVEKLNRFVCDHDVILLLSGAGISTESGVPDYRSESVGLYARTNHKPVEYRDYVTSENRRKTYWARNFIGWPTFSKIEPNSAHKTIAEWEMEGKLSHVVTQNVDKLHQKAGTRNVLELHGSGYIVKCMSCSYRIDRHSFQEVLVGANPSFVLRPTHIRPDGDVDLSQDEVDSFNVPSCPQCNGILKTNIVFFGESVPTRKVELVREHLRKSDALLVVGSSLFVYSGYRFALFAKEIGKPLAIVNIGTTRADKLAMLKLNCRAGDILPKIYLNSK